MVRSLRNIAIALFLGGVLSGAIFLCAIPATSGEEGLETPPIALVSGRSIWENGTLLEQLGATYPAYRCAGSAGANASAQWILSRFKALGLESWYEEFQFFGWDLRSRPVMEISFVNQTGVHNSTLDSFQAEQFSFPTGLGGSTGALVSLPLPETSSISYLTDLSYDPTLWRDLDVHDKVVLVGREVRWNSAWESGLVEKLQEGPSALVFYYSQSWTSSWEVMYMPSSGGRPLSTQGSYLYSNMIPVGHLDQGDSSWLLSLMEEGNVSANVTIDATTGLWAQRNVVAELPGMGDPDTKVMLTAHYDSVMDPGFCDNAASVSAMLEVASVLAEMKDKVDYRPKYTLLFVAFTGEEMGLIGSTYYYAKHSDEMDRVRAVINIDCLGASTMTRTPTMGGGGLDLGEKVDQAALELGLSLHLEEGASDQQSFLSPQQVAQLMWQRWGRSPSLPLDPTTVESSIGIFSGPLSPRETEAYGQAGWIHTSRDTSGYSLFSGWVTEKNLEDQTKVVLMVCIDVAGTAVDQSAFEPLIPFVIIASVCVVAVAMFYFLRRGRSH